MRTCRSCHFLTKTHVDRTGREACFSWNTEERTNARVADHYAAECSEGVWSTRITRGLRLEDLLATNRGRNCFYVKMQEGMSFPAARQLLELQEKNRRTRREWILIWVAVTTSLVGLISTATAVMTLVRS